MPIKLHTCPGTWAKFPSHPCWKVQKALKEQGIEYELVPGPGRHSRRTELEQLSGQRRYPVIEFPDGTAYRDESSAMAARIRGGELNQSGQ